MHPYVYCCTADEISSRSSPTLPTFPQYPESVLTPIESKLNQNYLRRVNFLVRYLVSKVECFVYITTPSTSIKLYNK